MEPCEGFCCCEWPRKCDGASRPFYHSDPDFVPEEYTVSTPRPIQERSSPTDSWKPAWLTKHAERVRPLLEPEGDERAPEVVSLSWPQPEYDRVITHEFRLQPAEYVVIVNDVAVSTHDKRPTVEVKEI